MPDSWWEYPIPPNVLIKQGNVVNADSSVIADVKIEDGIITEIARVIELDNYEENILVLDAQGMLVMPGGIDPNTHLAYNLKGVKTVDDFYYGTRAAVSGGTTTIIDFVEPEEGEPLEEAFQRRRRIADFEVVCDYALHMTLKNWNERIEKEMGQVVIGCGINSFMTHMSYRDDLMLTDSELYEAFFKCRKLGALAMVHAENGSIAAENVSRLINNGVRNPEGHYLAHPEILQTEATSRACLIAEQVDSPLYICSIMSEAAANVVRDKQKEGTLLFAETLAAAIGTIGPSRTASYRVASACVTTPPMSRNPLNPANLMNLLKTQVLTTVASSNCTYNSDQKARGRQNFSKIPNGVNGIEDRMMVTWEKGVNTGMLSLAEYVAVTSTNAAKLFNLYPKKGVIAEGSDADIVIWNPDRFKKISHHNHRQVVDYNIFHGMKVFGGPEYVFVRGKLCLDGDVLRVTRGYGNYLYAPCHSKMVYPDKTPMELQADDFGSAEQS